MKSRTGVFKTFYNLCDIGSVPIRRNPIRRILKKYIV